MNDDHDCQGASCSCQDGYQERRKPRVNRFTIPGTAGERGSKKSKPRYPEDEPLSLSGEEYKAQLAKEAEASIRWDLAMYGQVRRWPKVKLPRDRPNSRTEA